jgi:hypothetical protein
MGLIRASYALEDCLRDHAAHWQSLRDSEYAELVQKWRSVFNPIIEAAAALRRRDRAMKELQARLPCDAVRFNGVYVPRLAIFGQRRPSGYRACGLRSLDRKLANRLDLIVAPVDLSWCCVLSHEAYSFVSEELFDLK